MKTARAISKVFNIMRETSTKIPGEKIGSTSGEHRLNMTTHSKE
jgi:hypothetical protein